MNAALLIASSPVEIAAKADEGGLPASAEAAATDMFHRLTDRVGQVVVDLDIPHQDWPLHRFYFSEQRAALDNLLALLRSRADILDVTEAVPPPPGRIAGLFATGEEAGYLGVLVAHESHEGHG